MINTHISRHLIKFKYDMISIQFIMFEMNKHLI